jgi:hypothetical protein
MSRLFGYGLARSVLGTDGNWPLKNYDLHCRTAPERLRAVMQHGGDLLYIPPIYVTDPMTSDPVSWLKRTMAQYVNQGEDA